MHVDEQGVLAMEDECREADERIPSPAAGDSPVLRVVGALERVKPLRHSFVARIRRTACAVLDRRLQQQDESLMAEKAMLLLSPGVLKSEIRRALGTGLEKKYGENVALGRGLLQKATIANSTEAAEKKLRFSGSYAVGRRTMLDSLVEGTSIHLMELRLRLVHNPRIGDFENGRISVTTGTDLRSRHRVSLESMMGTEDDKHSISNIVSTDFSSPVAWGVATSHKLAKNLSLFSRYSSDHYSGRRVILQAVQRCGRNTISPICSVASKGRVQAGFTWKGTFSCSSNSKGRSGDDFFQLKALCSQNGVYSLFVKAQFGEPLEN